MFPVAGLFAEDDDELEPKSAGDNAILEGANEEGVEDPEDEHEEREHEFPCSQVSALNVERRATPN